MKKAPPTFNEEERLKSLEELNILDTPEEEIYDEITELTASICKTPIALVSLVDNKRQWFKSHHGLDARETPKEQAFCSHATLEEGVFEIKDSRKDERFYDNPLVTGNPHVIFYAGIPLTSPGDKNLGTLCVIDQKPNQLTSFQKKALTILGKQVTAQFELRRRISHFEESVRDIKQRNEETSNFMAHLSHEIRTPVDSIIGYIELLLESETEKEREKNLKKIDQSSNVLFELVNNTLDISKLESNLMKIEVGTIYFPKFLNEIKCLFENSMNQKNLQFSITTNTLPPKTQLDSLKLKKILINLLSNAYKFKDKGSITLEITYNEKMKRLAFRVQNTGIGIKKNHLETIFSPFEQIREDPNAENKGTGLGLSISSKLVEILGGELICKSTVNKGTCFSFSIPLDSSLLRERQQKDQSEPHCNTDQFKELKVLLIDDTKLSLDLNEIKIKKLGAKVTSKENSLVAIKKAQKERFDLIITDLNMPEKTGYQVFEEVKESGESQKAFFSILSGTALESEVKLSYDKGFHAYHKKPIRKKELSQLLAKALDFKNHHKK